MENGLLAGYSRVDITPDFPVGLAGYGMEEQRRNTEVRDHIYMTCIAVTSGEETILLFDADVIGINDWGVEQICKVVCPATGIPAEKIYCSATHTHSAPSFYQEMPSQIPFYQLLLEGAVQSAMEALADRAPAQLSVVTRKLKNMNFVRHYLMEDGTYFGSNFGNKNQAFVNHAAESDPRMMLVQFAREGKKNILLMNWQAHNDSVAHVGRYALSASYTGEVRKKMEAETDTLFAFVMGAAGNQNPGSFIDREHHNLPNHFVYARKLADYAIEFMKDLQPVKGTEIVTTRMVFEAQADHSMDHMVEQAKEVVALWQTDGKQAGDALGKTYGFSSVYHADEAINKAKRKSTLPIVLNAFRIGDLGFITSPNEVFSTVGIHVRLHGPFENTFIITGNYGYLPCMAAYEYGAYEVAIGPYAKGTAEAVADAYVEMLESIQ